MTVDPLKSETGVTPTEPKKRPRVRKTFVGTSILAEGDPMVWLSGGALLMALVMIIGLLGLVITLGMGTFRPLPLVQVEMLDGTKILGEVTNEENFPLTARGILDEPVPIAAAVVKQFTADLNSVTELTDAIAARRADEAAQVEELEASVAELKQHIDDINRSQTDSLESVESRVAYVRSGVASELLPKIRDEVDAAANRIEGLRGEMATADEAIAYFKSAADGTPAEKILAAPPAVQRIAVAALLEHQARQQGVKHVTAHRRLFRTGNFDLTGVHFRWIADYQIKDETLPPDAVTIERTAWGRFFGEPRQFIERRVREPSDEERELAEIALFLEINASSLDDTQRMKLDEAMPRVRQRLDEVRKKNVQSFLAEHPADDETTMQAIVGGAATPVADVDADADVSEVQEVWSGADTAWQKYNELHDEIRARFHRRQQLEKHELGAVSKQIDDARLAVRQAELDYEVNIRETVRELTTIRAQIRAIEESLADFKQTAAAVGETFGEEDPLSTLADAMFASLAKQSGEQLDELGSQRTALEAKVAKLPEPVQTTIDSLFDIQQQARIEGDAIQKEIDDLKEENTRYRIVMATADGAEATLDLGDIVRAYPANRLDTGEKWAVYGSRWWEFLSDEPRDANSEGGVFPAIWGTIVMTLIMSLAVAPFGVLAALYLREYAKGGAIVSAVRIAINNLAGVPSIVFGVFGLGFFCYIMGGWIDGGPKNAFDVVMPTGLWYWTGLGFVSLLLLGIPAVLFNARARVRRATPLVLNMVLALPLAAVWGYIALRFAAWCFAAEDMAQWTIRGIATGTICLVLGFVVHHITAQTNDSRSALERVVSAAGVATLFLAVVVGVFLIATLPFFHGFYEASAADGQPTFGKGALVWASLTLALLTLPVVIVATEEALSAVPNSMREGSYGCGASKWQTIRRIVLPQALPGIMTGMILAMARGAGEVAPLMLVGAVKLAPELPLDGYAPFVHLDRSFMHLGFHVFDLGFQSQNSEAAKPMVYTTTLVLISIIAVLNITAVWLRSALRKRFQTGEF